MSDFKFTHLHVHSDHSLLDGYGTIKEYIKKAKEDGQTALALTDHNTLGGIYIFIKACQKEGIKPIPGIEFNMAPFDSENLGAKFKDRVKYDEYQRQIILNRGTHTHLTILAKNEVGLRNLNLLLKLSYEPDNFFEYPRIDINILKEHKEGLIVLSGCPHSEVNIRLRLKQKEKAYEYASIMKEIFKDDFYIEIMKNDFVDDYSPKDLLQLAKDLDIKYVITNDVHYANQSDSEMQERFMAIGSRTKMSELPSYKGGFRPALGGNDRYLKTTEEMKKLFNWKDFENLHLGILETKNIVDKVEVFSLDYDSHLRPEVVIPEEFDNNVEFLKHLIKEGFKKKRGNQSKEIQKASLERIKHELQTVISNDFVDYFLVTWDMHDWCKRNNVYTGAGRGSAGGCEILFLLDCTKTDPLRYDLLFERFISPGRGPVYEIEYEDGTSETVSVSDVKILSDKTKKFVHQLEVGDEICD